jgi:hypothetical protein
MQRINMAALPKYYFDLLHLVLGFIQTFAEEWFGLH